MNLIHRELPLRKGDTVYLLQQVDNNWFKGERHGTVGIFPVSHVEVSQMNRPYMQLLDLVSHLIVKLPVETADYFIYEIGNLQCYCVLFVLSVLNLA